MRACMDENGMKFEEGEVDELTHALFHDATFISDPSPLVRADGGQGITFEALKAQLTKHEGLLQNLSISIDRWLVPPKPKRPNTLWEMIRERIPHQMTVPYVRNNGPFILFSLIMAVINVSLFAARCYEYRNFKMWNGIDTNYWVIFARAGGQCLNLNSMLILVLMLRHSITKLRQIGLAANLVLDRHIYFHKVTGRLISIYTVLHTAAHIGNLGELTSFK